MPPREHAAAHDAIDDLPLVTASATVTEVEEMDLDRSDEAIRAIDQLLTVVGIEDDVDVADREERQALLDRLAAAGHAHVARRVAALAWHLDRPGTMLVRVQIRPDRKLQHLAGQYVGLRYGRNSRAYSLASSPNRREIELCVRRVPDGRLSPKLCGDLAVGDEVTLRGPHGHMTLGAPSTRDLAFLATGTGVAPFKGMLDYCFEEGLDGFDGVERDVWLFLGAAWEDDLPYHDAFSDLAAEHENFHYVPTCSRESYLTDWDRETDYVQHAFLKHVDEAAVLSPLGRRIERWIEREPDSGVAARIDPANLEVYACGINAMVHSLVQAVDEVGVPEAFVESEGFG